MQQEYRFKKVSSYKAKAKINKYIGKFEFSLLLCDISTFEVTPPKGGPGHKGQ